MRLTAEQVLDKIWSDTTEVVTVDEELMMGDDWGILPGVYICGKGNLTLMGDLDGNLREQPDMD